MRLAIEPEDAMPGHGLALVAEAPERAREIGAVVGAVTDRDEARRRHLDERADDLLVAAADDRPILERRLDQALGDLAAERPSPHELRQLLVGDVGVLAPQRL